MILHSSVFYWKMHFPLIYTDTEYWSLLIIGIEIIILYETIHNTKYCG